MESRFAIFSSDTFQDAVNKFIYQIRSYVFNAHRRKSSERNGQPYYLSLAHKGNDQI